MSAKIRFRSLVAPALALALGMPVPPLPAPGASAQDEGGNGARPAVARLREVRFSRVVRWTTKTRVPTNCIPFGLFRICLGSKTYTTKHKVTRTRYRVRMDADLPRDAFGEHVYAEGEEFRVSVGPGLVFDSRYSPRGTFRPGFARFRRDGATLTLRWDLDTVKVRFRDRSTPGLETVSTGEGPACDLHVEVGETAHEFRVPLETERNVATGSATGIEATR